MKTGAELIIEERKRQIEVEGYTLVEDADYESDTLVLAAVSYSYGSVNR